MTEVPGASCLGLHTVCEEFSGPRVDCTEQSSVVQTSLPRLAADGSSWSPDPAALVLGPLGQC